MKQIRRFMDTLIIALQKAIEDGNWWQILLALAAIAAIVFTGTKAVQQSRKK